MACRFSGSSSNYMSRGSSLPSQSTLSALMSLRVVTDTNTYAAIFGIDDGSWEFIILTLDSDGTSISLYQANNGGANQANIPNVVNLTVGTNYFVGFTKSGTSAKVYVRAAGTYTWTTGSSSSFQTSTSGTTMYVGKNGFNEPLNGRVGNLKIWDAQLTDAEMMHESLQYEPARFTSIYGWYPMIEGSGGRNADYSSGNHGLTVSGTVTTEEGAPIPWRVGRRKRAPYAVSSAADYSTTFRMHAAAQSGTTWRLNS